MVASENLITNRCFDEIQIGDSAEICRRLTMEDIKLFAVVSGDVNPAHLDVDYAKDSMFHEIIAHGLWGGALISTVLGTQLPGPGTIYVSQSLHFKRPVHLGDQVTVRVTVTDKNADKKSVSLHCECLNQNNKIVIEGQAEVLAPQEKVSRTRTELPSVRLTERGQLQKLYAATTELAPLATAVVHPCSEYALKGAVEAAEADLIVPKLIAPRDKLQALADELAVDISEFEILDVPHSHAAAETAIQLARSSQVGALMKGSLHTDELMHAVLDKTKGIRTERRVSHVFAFDVPTYPRPLLVTDAAINIRPDLDIMRDIVQNAIDLAHALAIAEPKVAFLSAVETVRRDMDSTLMAAALCKMADRGQITGGLLDGPLAFDNAVSEDAARVKGIQSKVAGHADILVAPDLEAANILAKQLIYLADAKGAGLVMGARIPIILTSRADSEIERKASCALALLYHHHQQKAALQG